MAGETSKNLVLRFGRNFYQGFRVLILILLSNSLFPCSGESPRNSTEKIPETPISYHISTPLKSLDLPTSNSLNPSPTFPENNSGKSLAQATPVIAKAPVWFQDLPGYPSLQKFEITPQMSMALGLSRNRYFVEGALSQDRVPVLAGFYIQKLLENNWKVVQELPLNKEESQQVTFNRNQNGIVQVLTLYFSSFKHLAGDPVFRVLAEKINSGLNFILFIAGADPVIPKPQIPETANFPATISAENLTFNFGDGWVAQGQITFPANQPGPFPAVILVHGSGPNDLDQTIPDMPGLVGGSKIFLQLAQFLPSRGFAVIRYNRRGVLGVGPQISPDLKFLKSITHTRLTQDAGYVLKEALKNPRVNPKRIILLGQSEGSLNVTNLAVMEAGKDLAGVVLMGPQAYDLKTSLQYQVVERTIQFAHQSDPDQDGKLNVEEFQATLLPWSPLALLNKVDILEQENPGSLAQKFTGKMDTNKDNLIDIELELRPYLQALIASFPLVNLPQFGEEAVSFLLDWQNNGSVTQGLPGFKKPVLILNGENDTQTPVQGAREINAALEKAGNPDHNLITFPGLGHTFYPAQGFIQPPGPIQEGVLVELGNWLEKRFKTPG